jgi:hypothetical protein
MFILDATYTQVYNSGSYRNKVMWIRDMQPDTLDYALFGSSRTKYTVNPTRIEKVTGKKGVNLGMNASGPFEVQLAVKEFFKHTFAKRIFVQVDYTYYMKAPDSIGQLVWLPYIKEKEIFESFKPFGKAYKGYKQIPMYRYLQFDGSLGFRNVALSLLGKSPDFLVDEGFKTRAGMLQHDTPYPYTLEEVQNKHIAEIITLAKEKQIALSFFTAPIYKPVEDFLTLEENLPNYKNMSNTIQKKIYFSDHMHVNTEGATLFTEQFIETFFFTFDTN